MVIKNSQRMLVKIIKEVCAEKGIGFESFSYDWILRLTRADKTVHIFGYQFDNNSAATQLICTDKCATCEILRARGIPCVEHIFFITPDDFQYLGIAEGNWPRMLQLLNQHSRLVCKPNEGTGGEDVYLVSTPAEMESAARKIFSRSRSLAVSPFYTIDHEYRVIVLNQQVKLVYSKTIPSLQGDGSLSVRQLFMRYVQDHPDLVLPAEMNESELNRVPAPGENVALTWKHNLGLGAHPEIVETEELKTLLGGLALRAAAAVNARFASVDVIFTGGEYRILEINSGIMMESFARQDAASYQTAKGIYQAALLARFE